MYFSVSTWSRHFSPLSQTQFIELASSRAGCRALCSDWIALHWLPPSSTSSHYDWMSSSKSIFVSFLFVDEKIFCVCICHVTNSSLSTGPKEWRECPEYSTETPHQCFFNEEHTTIWTQYSVQLRSRDRAVLYDELFFYVQDIVEPDPPVGLNWTLLNVSLTGTHFDIMVNWRPPESADVKMGWMTLSYEVQHRSLHSDHWETDLVSSTHRTLYGLQTNVNHEVRVRCKMHGMTRFGGFSDSAFVHIQSKGKRRTSLCLVAILMLVIISQQEKLMVVLLPPVPEPKIKGVDSQLLKVHHAKGLNSLSGHLLIGFESVLFMIMLF
uniref:Fibronectin type-III domain-containing protein n=1 Tax=Oryzias melastigma TaxID=30732 RepID=A0A3B3D661_ORYME